MNFVFLMDPLEQVVYEKDTTYILMRESFRRKHRVFYLSAGGIFRKNGKTFFDVLEVKPTNNKLNLFKVLKKAVLTENEVNVVFIRTDPPFDAQYLHNTWMLDLLPGHIFVINNPLGVRTVNEKIWATQFTSVIPRTLVASNQKAISAFIKENKKVIAKPTDGYGGKSVFKIDHCDFNRNVIIETLTQNYSRDIIIQQYIKEAEHGDKRILLLEGEPLGAVNRIHAPKDHRNNFFSGGKPKKAVITKQDEKIISLIRPYLKRLGLYFVGIDIIGNYLIEINVTSPTCAQEINRLNKIKIEKKIIDYVERMIPCPN